MIKRNPAKYTQTETKQQKGTPRRWPIFILIIVCGLMLVSGFFFAGRQHFSSMDYGMKNSRLRKQIDALDAEKRRLLLAREISLSPTAIKKAAKKAGFTDTPEAQPEYAKLTAPTTKEKAIPLILASVSSKPMIVKTASVNAAPASVAAMYSKSEKTVKPITVKRTTAAE